MSTAVANPVAREPQGTSRSSHCSEALSSQEVTMAGGVTYLFGSPDTTSYL